MKVTGFEEIDHSCKGFSFKAKLTVKIYGLGKRQKVILHQYTDRVLRWTTCKNKSGEDDKSRDPSVSLIIRGKGTIKWTAQKITDTISLSISDPNYKTAKEEGEKGGWARAVHYQGGKHKRGDKKDPGLARVKWKWSGKRDCFKKKCISHDLAGPFKF